MKNVLIGTFSCKSNLDRVNELQRLKIYEGFDNQYYVISRRDSEHFKLYNCLSFDIDDCYERLIFKTIELFKYFIDSKYEYCFKCDDDSFVDLQRLSNFDYKKVDYAGLFVNTNIKDQLTYFKDKNMSYKGEFRDTLKYSFCVGGGYFVSKKVAETVVNNYKKSYEYHRYEECGMAACEDRMVGQLVTNDFVKFSHGKIIEGDTASFHPDSDKVFYSALFDSVYHSVGIDILNKIPHKSLGHIKMV